MSQEPSTRTASGRCRALGGRGGPQRRSGRRRCAQPAAVVLGLLLLSALAWPAEAGKRRRGSAALLESDWASTPAARYANLAPAACLAELARRRIVHQRVAEARGVVTPVRIVDGVGGVVYRTALAREQRAASPHDLFDCRLVLALDDFSRILRAHDVDEVLIFSGWRPPPKRWPQGREAIRHPGAMAIDIRRFGRYGPASPPLPAGAGQPRAEPAPARRRVWLDVRDHFGGHRGSATCSPGSGPAEPASLESKELHAIVCELAAARIFTSILTPNYDRAHASHLHFDLTPKVKWRIVR